MKNTVEELAYISSRIDHLESAADWIARETVHNDSVVSQTATLIMTVADELREKMCELVSDLEKTIELRELH